MRPSTGQLNWVAVWQLDPNAAVGPAEFDFFAALNHELTHALGFSDGLGQTGTPGFGNAGDGTGQWTAYDKFLADKNGTRIVGTANFILNTAAFNQASTGGACGNGMFFVGANAVAANGGNPVCIFSPNPFQEGSSLSHLDTATFPTSMMKPDRDFGTEARNWNAVEVGIMRDLGYSNTSTTVVPEPATFSLTGVMLAAGFFLRRRIS